MALCRRRLRRRRQSSQETAPIDWDRIVRSQSDDHDRLQ